MLLIALIGVCFALLRELPGLGILALIVVTPAMGRTLHGCVRHKQAGLPLSAWEKAGLFLNSAGIVLTIGLTAVVAFIGTCLPAGVLFSAVVGPLGMMMAVPAGIGVTAWIGLSQIRRLWPLQDPP
jgi:hypothetical protein